MKSLMSGFISFLIAIISCLLQSVYQNELFYAPILIIFLIPVVQILRDPTTYPRQFAPLIGILIGIPSGSFLPF